MCDMPHHYCVHIHTWSTRGKVPARASTGRMPIKCVPSLVRMEALSNMAVDHAVMLVGSLTKIIDYRAGNEIATLGIWKRAINH